MRTLAGRILERAGYTVLSAESGASALSIAAVHSGTIHILVTNVVMPGMNGQELAEALRATRPDTKVLYVSGCAVEAVARQSVSDKNGLVLEKPFTVRSLLEGVRLTLGGGKR